MSAIPVVERDIDGAMGFRIGRTLPSRPRVIGRKYTTDETDDREALLTIVAYRIEIPPAIAVRRDGCIEAKSVSKAMTACLPDSAAIGTPGPGCTLPPAR